MTPKRTPPDEAPPSRIAAGLFKLALVIRHQGWKAAGKRGLTPTQSQILAHLGSQQGELGIKRIAAALAVTMGTASEAVSALERKQLLTKRPSASDGRAIVLQLTKLGRQEARRAAEWPEVLVQAADSLPAREQAGFLRGLVGMIKTLQERGAVPMSRMCVSCRFFRPNAHPGRDQAHHCQYIDAAIGDADLRIDCKDMEPAAPELQPHLWEALVGGHALDDDSPTSTQRTS